MNLNDSQTRAVEFFDGPCLVLAGPGSGKTAVLTLRVKRLIEKGVDPEKICVITFTKAAALEMQERFLKLSQFKNQVAFSTFHSLFWSILSKELSLKSENIIMGKSRMNLLKEAAKDCDFSTADNEFLGLLSTEISFINNTFTPIDGYKSAKLDAEKVKKAYRNYTSLKAKYKSYDFDDMLLKTYELFTRREDILKKWQKRFDYYLVDEMQDMNEIQFKLIEMLSVNKNIFCVGDDDQSIYSFRGARPQLMQSFEKVYPGCEKILLNINYRCPKNIVEKSLRLIENNQIRFSKEISAFNKDGVIQINETFDKREEARWVSEKIAEFIKAGDNPGNIAILYRNHNEVSYIVDQLLQLKIPFYLKEKMPNIYSHFIFEDMLSYFQIAIGNSTRERLLSIINKPNRYVMRQALEDGYSFDSIKKFYSFNNQMILRVSAFERDMSLIGKMSAFCAANYIRQAIGYEGYLRELAASNGSDFSEYQDVFNFFLETVRDCKTLKKAIEKINYLKLKVDFENKSKESSKDNKIGLYTLHSAKGLEFENVFIIGVNEGILPSKQSKSREEIEGERRLFYVGVTRAKKKLYISYMKEKNRERIYPSRFINEFLS